MAAQAAQQPLHNSCADSSKGWQKVVRVEKAYTRASEGKW